MSREPLVHEIHFYPAFDKRHPDPSKNYGICSATMSWYVRGPEGVIQFVVYTGWSLPEVHAELEAKYPHRQHYKPMPADLGYHAKSPQYEDQTPIEKACEFVGGPCYYDGSTLNAERIFNLLVTKGHEAVWDELDRIYARRFRR